ncbi:hypothetical protein C8R43DRAFT_31041 [Mycena crocata]|nr:hypothetical protein C8R43DRAFT_31041 [Mycena crocata]
MAILPCFDSYHCITDLLRRLLILGMLTSHPSIHPSGHISGCCTTVQIHIRILIHCILLLLFAALYWDFGRRLSLLGICRYAVWALVLVTTKRLLICFPSRDNYQCVEYEQPHEAMLLAHTHTMPSNGNILEPPSMYSLDYQLFMYVSVVN